jgi:DNA transformation protein and related proteins
MVGGHGIYYNDIMFGLLADNVLYLKADAESAVLFEDLGLGPFQYIKNGKSMNMSYFMAPADIYEDPSEAKVWAGHAYEAAVRSRKPTSKSK